MQDDAASLLDIVQACRRLGRHIAGMDQSAFDADEKTQDAVIRQLEIIGEAAKRLSPCSGKIIPVSHGSRWQACAIFSSTNTIA